MKNILFFLASLALATAGFAGDDNVYVAGGTTVSGSSHSTIPLVATAGPSNSSQTGTAAVLDTGFVATVLNPGLTNSGTTYATNVSIGGLLTFSNAVREPGGTARIKDLVVVDANSTVQSGSLTLILFDGTTLTGTYTDHATVNVSAADVPHIIRKLNVVASDYSNVGGTALAVADPSGLDKSIVLNGTTTTMYGVLQVTAGTLTMSSSNTMTVKLGVNQN